MTEGTDNANKRRVVASYDVEEDFPEFPANEWLGKEWVTNRFDVRANINVLDTNSLRARSTNQNSG